MTSQAGLDSLREQMQGLEWPARFDSLARLAAQAPPDQRAAFAALRAEWAEEVLFELRANPDAAPVKDAILRLPSKQMRAAVGQAAKRARDRYITEVMSRGGEFSPEPFGAGLDERAIEIPLALATARLFEPGEVLDAGSSLNLPLVRSLVGRPRARMTHFTQAGDAEPIIPGDEQHFVRAFGDLRRLEFGDAAFDRIVCVSTLEHVGMNNDRYGGSNEQAPETVCDAVSELARVLAPGGELLITVPYGTAANHGWFRVLDAAALQQLVSPLQRLRVNQRFFYHDRGWSTGGSQPPAAILASPALPDVVTGIAVVRAFKERDPF